MAYSIFISSVHEDAHHITNLKSWASTGLLGDNVVITHETEDKRYEGFDAIRKHIRSKIEGAGAILILVGQNTHNHDWIRVEVELANSFNKKIIVVRINGTTGNVPPILANKSEIPFDPSSIKKSIGR